MPHRKMCVMVAAFTLLCVQACNQSSEQSKPTAATPGTEVKASTSATPEELSAELIPKIKETFTGDFDEIAKRRIIRALVVYSKTFYFLDGAQERGASYDALQAFEEGINKKLGTGNIKVHVVFIPVTRDKLLPSLVEGKGDIALGNLTITPERLKTVDFSDPIFTNVSEVVVTGASVPAMSSADDLSGKEVYVRKSSSYYESLTRLNEGFRKSGKPLIKIKEADERLESEDILEMVNAGLVPITIVDNHIARFWKQVFDTINVNENITVNTGGQIGWAFRKNSPRMRDEINAFAKEHAIGTLFGNMVLKKYLRDTKFVVNATSTEEAKKFRANVQFFQKYAPQYGFDWLMVAAQGYQESRLDQSVRSQVGAVGVMQILPTTAADKSVNIPNIDQPEPNIHAGVKYMRFMMDQYFKDAKMDRINKGLFAFASYNAGPAKVARLRTEAAEMGLDPNLWFNNVEIVAAKRIGRETVQYVSNIYKYYVAYKLITDQINQKKAAVAGG